MAGAGGGMTSLYRPGRGRLAGSRACSPSRLTAPSVISAWIRARDRSGSASASARSSRPSPAAMSTMRSSPSGAGASSSSASIKRQPQAEGDEHGAGGAVQPAQHGAPLQPALQRHGRGDQDAVPDESHGEVNGGEQHDERRRRDARRNELGQERD